MKKVFAVVIVVLLGIGMIATLFLPALVSNTH